MVDGKIKKIKDKYQAMVNDKQFLEKSIEEYNIEIAEKKASISDSVKAMTLLDEGAKGMRNKAKEGLEKIVTSALKSILNEEIRFEIEFTESAKGTQANFYLVSMVNGKEEKFDPVDECAGGYVDIVSVSLRYAYARALNEPKLGSYMVLDEPGKMVSEEASVRFAEFIKSMGQMFDMQSLIITHNTAVGSIGDNHIEVARAGDCSKVFVNKTTLVEEL